MNLFSLFSPSPSPSQEISPKIKNICEFFFKIIKKIKNTSYLKKTYLVCV